MPRSTSVRVARPAFRSRASRAFATKRRRLAASEPVWQGVDVGPGKSETVAAGSAGDRPDFFVSCDARSHCVSEWNVRRVDVVDDPAPG
jgi:hypothetical protein